MQPRCGSEIKISSVRNYLVQVRSRQQHSQHYHSPMPGECELRRPFAQKKSFTLPVESRPIHFHRHFTDICESALSLLGLSFICVDFLSECVTIQRLEHYTAGREGVFHTWIPSIFRWHPKQKPASTNIHKPFIKFPKPSYQNVDFYLKTGQDWAGLGSLRETPSKEIII